MRIRNIKLLRIVACVCVLLPILYILFNWGDGHAKARDFVSSRLTGGVNNQPRETPKLVEGKWEDVLTGVKVANEVPFYRSWELRT